MPSSFVDLLRHGEHGFGLHDPQVREELEGGFSGQTREAGRIVDRGVIEAGRAACAGAPLRGHGFKQAEARPVVGPYLDGVVTVILG